MMDIIVFNVELGQSIFFYPRNHPEYGMMIDCGNTKGFEPVDVLLKWNLIHNNKLSNLVLTNYDHDHFSGLPYLKSKVGVHSVNLSKNLSTEELRKEKEIETEALKHLINIKETYTTDLIDYNPPYEKYIFSLEKQHFPGQAINTNNLSQIVFVKYNGTTICIPGDLERQAWEIFLNMPHIQRLLVDTTIYFASHHGRENGYHEKIFEFCSPETIIISDKYIMHQTQQDMSSIYSKHIIGGVELSGDLRKVLTTRNDGHLWIRVEENGNRIYNKLTI